MFNIIGFIESNDQFEKNMSNIKKPKEIFHSYKLLFSITYATFIYYI